MKMRTLSIIMILTALVVIFFGNLSYNNYQAQASHYIKGNMWDENTCGGCHPGVYEDVNNSYHVMGDVGYMAINDWSPLHINLIEGDYTTELAREWGIQEPESGSINLVIDSNDNVVGHTTSDCRVCHLKGEGDFDWLQLLEAPPVESNDDSDTFDDVFLGTPSDEVCADRCHRVDVPIRAVMWSGDDYAEYDAHANASVGCTECHTTQTHQIGRNRTIDSMNPDVYPMQQCIDCHFEVTHGMYTDAHLVNVSCESCHIPMLKGGQLPGGSPLLSVDWTSGNRVNEYRVEDFQPVLAWFNGTVEGIPYPSHRNDSGVFLKPLNVIKVSWWDEGSDEEIAQDPDNSSSWGTPIILSHVRSADADNDGNVTFSEMRSFDAEMDGAPNYPDAVIRNRDVYYSISHNIISNSSDNAMGLTALWCVDCHGNTSRIDWPLLGYETDPAETDPPTNFSSYNVTVEIVPLRPKPEEIEHEPQLPVDLFGLDG